MIEGTPSPEFPPDDATIPDDAELWRRIRPGQWTAETVEGRTRLRPSGWAFDDSQDGSPMSVFIASETASPALVLVGHDGFALASLTAGVCRREQQRIVRAPEPNLPSHALVVGHKAHKRRSRLAKAARWVVEPDEVL